MAAISSTCEPPVKPQTPTMVRPRRPSKVIDGEVYLQCTKCQEWRAEDFFHKLSNPRSHCGKSSWCKTCANDRRCALRRIGRLKHRYEVLIAQSPLLKEQHLKDLQQNVGYMLDNKKNPVHLRPVQRLDTGRIYSDISEAASDVHVSKKTILSASIAGYLCDGTKWRLISKGDVWIAP